MWIYDHPVLFVFSGYLLGLVVGYVVVFVWVPRLVG
jgi:hypothetical protein